MELMHSFWVDNVLVDLLESILFYSGDKGNIIHRKDIDFIAKSSEVQEKFTTVQENSTILQCTSLNQQKIWQLSGYFTYLMME